MAKSAQYTIRGISEALDQSLRRQAEARHLSLNAYILSQLERINQQDFKDGKHHDFDFLIGSMEDGEAFDEALKEFGRIDEELWK